MLRRSLPLFDVVSANAPRAKPLMGVVVKAGLMDKTVTVKVPRTVLIPKYKKRVTRHTTLLVHDAENACDVGDSVQVLKSRPFSKRKHHIIGQILVKDAAAAFLAANPEFYRSRQDLKTLRQARLDKESDHQETERLRRLEEETLAQEAALQQQLDLDVPTKKED